jgi:hypothetical protein
MHPDLVLSAGLYPNSALSAGQLAIMAAVPVVVLAVWLIMVYAAAREPRHRDAARTTRAPQQPRVQGQEHEHPGSKAA